MIEKAASSDGKASADDIKAEIDDISAKLGGARDTTAKIILGQEEVIEETLITVLAGGHALLVGVPGLAKTRLVTTLGTVLGLDAKRIQFTPDLMPADITGAEVLEESETGERSFRFIKGPVFCQLLMADEINRASPRTQSALLQAMQELHVTVAGESHDLPRPFHVLATQNPLEQEGTYPLPEAQLDRFLLQIDIKYPTLAAERDILLETTGSAEPEPDGILSGEELIRAQSLVRRLPVGESVADAIVSLVRSARPEEEGAIDAVKENLAWGPGPRAGQALMLAVRARALLDGRYAPSIDDVIALAPAAMRHRMALNYAARVQGVTIFGLIEDLLKPLA